MKRDIGSVWATSGNLIYKLAIKFSGERTALSMAKSSPYSLTLLKNNNFHFKTE